MIILGYSRSVPNINEDENENSNIRPQAISTLPKRANSAKSALPTYKQALIVSRFNSLNRPKRSSQSFSEDRLDKE